MNNDSVVERLAAPFDGSEVKFKPAVVSGNRALALPYVDARAIQDRLDEVLGVAGWQDEYEVLPDGSVVCKLRCKLGDEWICKMDVGGPSEQPDEGDRRKAAFSDALKRAAVKFGIGRYLYRLPSQWVDYNPQKRQFIRPPSLPETARPSAPVAAPPVSFATRLREFDNRLALAGLCQRGECIKRVHGDAIRAGLPSDIDSWTESQQAVALGFARTFEAERRKPK